MVRAKRRKRASEDSLYRDCLEGRVCAPDIKAKYEQNTIADNILKWLSNFLWFGQLGIGTGKGSGGVGGYTRLGGGGGNRGVAPARPPVVVDSIGPHIITPIDSVDPGASSIVPLLEGDVIDVPTESTSNLPTGDIETIAETDPSHTNGLPDPVVVGESDISPAIIEVTEAGGQGDIPRHTVSSSTTLNPAFEAAVLTAQLPGETSVSDQLVFFNGVRGEHIGGLPEGESIPLTTFIETGGFDELSIEEAPSTSTPDNTLRGRLQQNFRNLRRQLYNRRTTQVNVRAPQFLSNPQELVKFEISNPAFETDVSLEFEQNLQDVEEAPDFYFRDLRRLSRPHYSTTPGGLLRVSRLGTKGTITTRSGAVIGGTVHYYSDITEIPSESIELTVLGDPTGEALIHSDSHGLPAIEDSSFTFTNGVVEVPLEEAQLLDDPEDFSNSRLVIMSEGRTITLGDIFNSHVESGLNFGGTTIFPPNGAEEEGDGISLGPSQTVIPESPLIILNLEGYGLDFYLHPSLLKKSKKLKHIL